MNTSRDFQATLEAAKAGVESAWVELYRDLAGPVAGYLRSRGATEPDDLSSETFLQVARGIKDFEGTYESFRSWVFVIAHRRLIDFRRAEGRRPRIVQDDEHLALIPAGIEVDSDAIGLVSASRMNELFGALTEDQRDVLALRVIGDLTVRQTAAVLGKGEGAVKALQRRALSSLRRAIEEAGVTI